MTQKRIAMIFGIVYALVAVMGVVNGDRPLLGIVSNNQADTGLHVVIALFALYAGFMMKPAPPSITA